jgi:3'-5' exoribonuclease
MAMKRQFAATLGTGDVVDTDFVVRSADVRAARTGETYLALEFSDRSGRVGGIMFRPPREAEAISAGTVVRVRGKMTSYRGALRVSVSAMRPTESSDSHDLLPVGTRDEKELLAALRSLVRSIADPGLARLVREVFGDVRLMRRFKICAATDSAHHAYIGGLLEHTVAVATLCRGTADVYPEIDADLLVAAALLHDLGVVDEIACGASLELTDEGRLLGHVALGARRLHAAVERLGEGLSPGLAARLEHAVMAHHRDGAGSGAAPCTLEALALAHADATDAAVAGFAAAIAGVGATDRTWTDAANAFGRPMRAPSVREEASDRGAARPGGLLRSA